MEHPRPSVCFHFHVRAQLCTLSPPCLLLGWAPHPSLLTQLPFLSLPARISAEPGPDWVSLPASSQFSFVHTVQRTHPPGPKCNGSSHKLGGCTFLLLLNPVPSPRHHLLSTYSVLHTALSPFQGFPHFTLTTSPQDSYLTSILPILKISLFRFNGVRSLAQGQARVLPILSHSKALNHCTMVPASVH